MVYVLFEVTLKDGKQDAYLAHATSLKQALAQQVGFIRSERFESLATPGKLLSLSVWENENAIQPWRNQIDHRACQSAGRENIFRDYRITVLSPETRMYGMDSRTNAPQDSETYFAQ